MGYIGKVDPLKVAVVNYTNVYHQKVRTLAESALKYLP